MNFELLIIAFCIVIGFILTLDLFTFIIKPSAGRLFDKLSYLLTLIICDIIVVYYILNGYNLF